MTTKNNKISRSLVTEANSAKARINIPLNLEAWKDLPQDQQDKLLWFHQHLLKEHIGWDGAAKLLPKPGNPGKRGETYDNNTIYKVLRGIHEGSWENICNSIDTYRELWDNRRKLVKSTFAENEISELIFGGLDYAMAANGITVIIGESGQGKSICGREWQERNNHGRTVMVEAPVVGGTKLFLREIVAYTGHNQNHSICQMCDNIRKAFNPSRMLIIDEGHRLIPSQPSTTPRSIEFLRWLHDQTGCALALLVTARFDETLRSNSYMYEQFLGRIDMPVTLPKEMDESSWLPLVTQYIPAPTGNLKTICNDIVNRKQGGRMRRLDKILRFASAKASELNEPLSEKHLLASLKLLKRMQGQSQYAAKSKR